MYKTKPPLEFVEARVRAPGVIDRIFKWAGIGCMLEVESAEGSRIMMAYSLTRQDGKRYFDNINYNAPEVVRFVSDSDPERSMDWAGYGCQSNNVPMHVDVYKLPTIITDMNYHLYGEWPVSNGRIPFENRQAFADAETVIEFGEGTVRDTRLGTYRNLGVIGLEDAGTMPVYPYKDGTHHYVEPL